MWKRELHNDRDEQHLAGGGLRGDADQLGFVSVSIARSCKETLCVIRAYHVRPAADRGEGARRHRGGGGPRRAAEGERMSKRDLLTLTDLDLAVGLDQDRPESAPKQGPVSAVAPVVVQGVAAAEVLHGRRQATLGSVDEEVIVVGHQRVRVDLEIELTQQVEEVAAIEVVPEDRLFGGPAVHHVVPGVRIVDS